jgi:hypothetical protein
MKEIDFERAALLMDMQQKVANISPQNTGILSEVSAELKEIEADARENQKERAAETKRLEAEEAAKRNAEARKFHEDMARRDTEEAKRRGRPQPEPILPGQPVRNPTGAYEPPEDADADGIDDDDEVITGEHRPNPPPRRA